ncbi:MAG: hypothetical protein CM15mP4_1810 [Candidatus Neomarinimicrobiota bacterium]|nr:MAG: hypothetical protein CM15mP4_1810 [Candidatus Neomarinimicrobiota bacterium]
MLSKHQGKLVIRNEIWITTTSSSKFNLIRLLRFEINIRASTILGFVGAGGIGQAIFW